MKSKEIPQALPEQPKGPEIRESSVAVTQALNNLIHLINRSGLVQGSKRTYSPLESKIAVLEALRENSSVDKQNAFLEKITNRAGFRDATINLLRRLSKLPPETQEMMRIFIDLLWDEIEIGQEKSK